MILKLSELFIFQTNKQFYTKQELITLKLSSSFINNMQVILNLSYLETTTLKGNVCFANNSDVQPDFRTVFTKNDVINYVNALLNKNKFDIEKDKVLFPTNNISFWETIKKGCKL